MRLKKGDEVIVLSGKDIDKKGEIISVEPKTNKVVVKGINVVKKHKKPRKQGEPGGIISMEAAMPAGKVALVCPKCGKATKVGYIEEKGEKVRVCKKCGAKLK